MRTDVSDKAPASSIVEAAKRVLLVAAGAVIILLPVFANGFPFVFPDSVDYLLFNYYLVFRSPFYGLFILFFHLNQFVWLPVVVQSLILSHLLWTVLRLMLPQYRPWKFALCTAVLTAFSSLPIVAGFILADVFTPAMILTMYLLAFQHHRLSKLEIAYYFLLLCVAISVHLSHLPIAAALCTVGILLVPLCRCPGRSTRSSLALTGTPIVLALIAIVLQNAAIHKTVAISQAGTSFMLANLIEQGPARGYLEEVCPDRRFRICSELSRMPQNAEAILFITYPRVGGFEAMRAEAGTILLETLRSRPMEVAHAALRTLGRAMIRRAPGAELVPLQMPNAAFMENVLRRKFGESAVQGYLASAQSNNRVPVELLKAIDSVVFPISLLTVLCLGGLAFWDQRNESFALAAFVITGIVANTIVCALTTGPYDRFQSRVSWLLPLLAILLLARVSDHRLRESLRATR